MQLQGMFTARGWRVALAGMLALLAAGCSDTDDGGPDGGGPAMAAVGGVAAVGAPIVGGTITARCSGGQTFSATTGANGSYSIELPRTALPCALQVTGGTAGGVANALTFHSFATAAGTANLTPITDLAVAIASGMSPSAWFAAISANAPPQLRNLAQAAASVLRRLEDAGYSVPNGLNPVTTPFTATLANAYDQLLESLGAALRTAAMSYDQLLVQVVEEGDDFDPPEPPPPPGNDRVPGTVNPAMVGTYTLTYHQEAAGAPFTNLQQVPVTIGANNTLQIDGKTLTNPFNRKLNGSTSPHLPELIWIDTARNIEYALSDNQSGTFNEINVGDASRPQPAGFPFFLGQLRKPAVTVTIPSALNGNYTPRILQKSGPLNYTVGNNLPITIGSSSISVDNGKYLFQPSDEGYRVFNNTNSTIEPNYRVTKNKDATHVEDLIIYVNGDTIVAFKLELSELFNGGAAVSSLYVEPRPLPQNVLDFINLAKTKSPATLTVVQDDTGYNSGYPAKCSQMKLSMFTNGEGDGLSFTYFLQSGPQLDQYVDQEIYQASNTRYLENSGNKILAFSRNRISLRADGFVDSTALLGSSVKDRATNDPAQISAACPQG